MGETKYSIALCQYHLRIIGAKDDNILFSPVKAALPMSSVPLVRKPCDVICMLPLKLRTIQDGDVFMFPTLDVYSEFLFQAPVERGDDMEYLLKSIQLLLNNNDFKSKKGKRFVLVLPEYQEHRSQIELLIRPHGGSLIYNQVYVENRMAPAIEYFLKTVKNRR